MNAPRNTDLAKIHLAKKQLNLSDEDYRTILWRQGSVSSARDLTAEGRRKVLAYFEQQGFKQPRKPFGQPEKIAWLWRKLGKAGALRDPSQAALMAFVVRTAGTEVSYLKFLPIAQASKVIEALKAMLDRAGRPQ